MSGAMPFKRDSIKFENRDVRLEKWEYFPKALKQIRSLTPSSRYEMLFRGMPNSQFQLRSTLERSALSTDGILSVRKFIDQVEFIRPTVESLRNTDIPRFENIDPSKFFDDREVWYEKHYQYLIYLRHHGFPSPLLDWTTSPYVAAFFAFRDEVAWRSGDSEAEVSIFAYVERPHGHKSVAHSMPHIYWLGPRTKAHIRHIRQQSCYTVCVQDRQQTSFVPYSTELTSLHGNPGQDVFWKITLPASERPKVIGDLESMNINAYSLFDSEDSLMETLYNRCVP